MLVGVGVGYNRYGITHRQVWENIALILKFPTDSINITVVMFLDNRLVLPNTIYEFALFGIAYYSAIPSHGLGTNAFFGFGRNNLSTPLKDDS